MSLKSYTLYGLHILELAAEGPVLSGAEDAVAIRRCYPWSGDGTDIVVLPAGRFVPDSSDESGRGNAMWFLVDTGESGMRPVSQPGELQE